MKKMGQMLQLVTLAGLSVVLFGCAANAPQQASSGKSEQVAVAPGQADNDSDGNGENECQIEKETGSHIRDRNVCMSEADREALGHTMSSMQSQMGGPSGSANAGR